MSKEINNEIKGNKNCKIDIKNEIKNIMAPDDKLAKHNIFDENIKDKKILENEFSERIRYAEKVYTEQLPKELKNYFEIKSEKVGNNMEFLAKPKTKDAYEKFPPKISFSYKTSNVKGLDKFKSNNFFDLIQEMYEKQEGIVIEDPYNLKEFLGNIENPASIFSEIDSNAKSTIYINPQPYPPAIAYNIKLFNNYYEFELKHVMLRIEKIENDIYTFSNYESFNDKYDIKVKIKFGQIKNNFSIMLKIRELYSTDAETIKEFIKYDLLIHDVESLFIFQFSENDKTIFETKNFGEKPFVRKDYKNIKKELNFLEKVIFIEKRKNIKFNYNENLLKEKQTIYFLYNEVQGKNYTFTGELMWTFDIKDDEENIKMLQRACNQKNPVPIVANMDNIEIEGKCIKFENHKLIIEKSEIISVEREKDHYKVKIKATNAKVEVTNNR